MVMVVAEELYTETYYIGNPPPGKKFPAPEEDHWGYLTNVSYIVCTKKCSTSNPPTSCPPKD